MHVMFTTKIGVNAYTQFSRKARNDRALGHFELVEKCDRLLTNELI